MLHIEPSRLSGRLTPPSSKSHTLRSLLFALMAHGQSRIANPLQSPDTTAMIRAISQFGAHVKPEPNSLLVTGGFLRPPQTPIDCGNSGQILRFLGATASLLSSPITFTGDDSIQRRRPIQPLISALQQLGAQATSSPLTIQGPLLRSCATLSGEDSQPVSGLLIAASFAPHPIELHVDNPGETPWIDLTLHWLNRLHIPITRRGYTYYSLPGNSSIAPFHCAVPADFSSAAYPIAAALLTQSALTLEGLDFNDPQGDKALISLLERQGARITVDSALHVHPSPPLRGGSIDVNPFIDALPLLATLACFAAAPTHLTNAAIARRKESDRIAAIAQELTKMGAHLQEFPDGLLIHPAPLHGHPNLTSHSDHRIALSLITAALAAHGPSTLYDTEVIAKSYPNCVQDFQTIGAQLRQG